MTNLLLLALLCAPCDPACDPVCDPQAVLATARPAQVLHVAQDGAVSTLAASDGITLQIAPGLRLVQDVRGDERDSAARVLVQAQRAQEAQQAEAARVQRALLDELRAAEAQMEVDPRASGQYRRALEQAQEALEQVELGLHDAPALAELFEDEPPVAFEGRVEELPLLAEIPALSGLFARRAQEQSEAKSLEERVRALERIAGDGGGAGDGTRSLEERVAALERALRGGTSARSEARGEARSEARSEARAGVRAESGARAGALRALERDEQEKIQEERALRFLRTAPEAPQARSRVRTLRPSGPDTWVLEDEEGRVVTVDPRGTGRTRVWKYQDGRLREVEEAPQPAPPAAPAPVLPPDADGPYLRYGARAPAPLPGGSKERQRLEKTVRALRAEADTLREEMRRLRAEIEQLPRR